MLCLNCGKSLAEGARSGLCDNCQPTPIQPEETGPFSKNKANVNSAEIQNVSDDSRPAADLENVIFANFVERFVAKIVDLTIIVCLHL